MCFAFFCTDLEEEMQLVSKFTTSALMQIIGTRIEDTRALRNPIDQIRTTMANVKSQLHNLSE